MESPGVKTQGQNQIDCKLRLESPLAFCSLWNLNGLPGDALNLPLQSTFLKWKVTEDV
jgi:hypothetical protein